jgi:hypothetical protein
MAITVATPTMENMALSQCKPARISPKNAMNDPYSLEAYKVVPPKRYKLVYKPH